MLSSSGGVNTGTASRYSGALLSVLENFRPPFLLTRLTAPGSPRMGVLNQQILIHRCLLYEESMECGPPCHISGCKKVQFYYLRLVYLYRLKSTKLILTSVISCHHAIFNAGRYLFRFRRFRHCGKQQILLVDFKKVVVPCTCGTKREFCLETLLACICGRLGCKNISLTM